ERQRALDEVAREVGGLDLVLGIVLCAAIAGVAVATMRALFRYVLPASIPASFASIACYAALFLSIFLMLRFLHRWRAARALRRKLIAGGVPVCLACGYRLSGLPAATETCPECGRPIEPRVTELLEAGASAPVLGPRPSTSAPAHPTPGAAA